MATTAVSQRDHNQNAMRLTTLNGAPPLASPPPLFLSTSHVYQHQSAASQNKTVDTFAAANKAASSQLATFAACMSILMLLIGILALLRRLLRGASDSRGYRDKLSSWAWLFIGEQRHRNSSSSTNGGSSSIENGDVGGHKSKSVEREQGRHEQVRLVETSPQTVLQRTRVFIRNKCKLVDEEAHELRSRATNLACGVDQSKYLPAWFASWLGDLRGSWSHKWSWRRPKSCSTATQTSCELLDEHFENAPLYVHNIHSPATKSEVMPTAQNLATQPLLSHYQHQPLHLATASLSPSPFDAASSQLLYCSTSGACSLLSPSPGAQRPTTTATSTNTASDASNCSLAAAGVQNTRVGRHSHRQSRRSSCGAQSGASALPGDGQLGPKAMRVYADERAYRHQLASDLPFVGHLNQFATVGGNFEAHRHQQQQQQLVQMHQRRQSPLLVYSARDSASPQVYFARQAAAADAKLANFCVAGEYQCADRRGQVPAPTQFSVLIQQPSTATPPPLHQPRESKAAAAAKDLDARSNRSTRRSSSATSATTSNATTTTASTITTDDDSDDDDAYLSGSSSSNLRRLGEARGSQSPGRPLISPEHQMYQHRHHRHHNQANSSRRRDKQLATESNPRQSTSNGGGSGASDGASPSHCSLAAPPHQHQHQHQHHQKQLHRASISTDNAASHQSQQRGQHGLYADTRRLSQADAGGVAGGAGSLLASGKSACSSSGGSSSGIGASTTANTPTSLMTSARGEFFSVSRGAGFGFGSLLAAPGDCCALPASSSVAATATTTTRQRRLSSAGSLRPPPPQLSQRNIACARGQGASTAAGQNAMIATCVKSSAVLCCSIRKFSLPAQLELAAEQRIGRLSPGRRRRPSQRSDELELAAADSSAALESISGQLHAHLQSRLPGSCGSATTAAGLQGGPAVWSASCGVQEPESRRSSHTITRQSSFWLDEDATSSADLAPVSSLNGSQASDVGAAVSALNFDSGAVVTTTTADQQPPPTTTQAPIENSQISQSTIEHSLVSVRSSVPTLLQQEPLLVANGAENGSSKKQMTEMQSSTQLPQARGAATSSQSPDGSLSSCQRAMLVGSSKLKAQSSRRRRSVDTAAASRRSIARRLRSKKCLPSAANCATDTGIGMTATNNSNNSINSTSTSQDKSSGSYDRPPTASPAETETELDGEFRAPQQPVERPIASDQNSASLERQCRELWQLRAALYDDTGVDSWTNYHQRISRRYDSGYKSIDKQLSSSLENNLLLTAATVAVTSLQQTQQRQVADEPRPLSGCSRFSPTITATAAAASSKHQNKNNNSSKQKVLSQSSTFDDEIEVVCDSQPNTPISAFVNVDADDQVDNDVTPNIDFCTAKLAFDQDGGAMSRESPIVDLHQHRDERCSRNSKSSADDDQEPKQVADLRPL